MILPITIMVDLDKHISWIIDAHQNHSKEPSNALRFWDMKTPYSIHPIWCAITLLTETKLPNEIRGNGALALLYHDILEDTKKDLPDFLSKEVKKMVDDMTYYGGLVEEMEKVWEKDELIILLKLYDKVSTLLDAIWMKDKKRRSFEDYTQQLNNEVKKVYGELNITRIADAILRS